MASGLSVYYANKLLNTLMRGEAFSTPSSSYWVAAFTASNASTLLRTYDGTNYAAAVTAATEVSTSGTAYARIEVKGSTGIDWSVAAGGSTNQDTGIVWNAASGSWGTVYTVALMDAVSAGNVVCFADISPSRPIASPDVLRIPVNLFVVNL